MSKTFFSTTTKRKMINTTIDTNVLEQFRRVIYNRSGLHKGDFRNAIEEAMKDYIWKYEEFSK